MHDCADSKQGAFEPPKDYYNRMVDIGVALREYHQDRFQPRELVLRRNVSSLGYTTSRNTWCLI